MRFVHLADVHLDTSFAGRSATVRRRLREASRDAFRRTADLAIREDANALLIAGDLFDGDRLSFQTERFLLEQMRRLEQHGVTVVYATGNHDPGSPLSGPRQLDWPANVHVAWDATPKRILIHDLEGGPAGYVSAAGHESDQEKRDLSRLLPDPKGDLPEVALLHTQVHSSPGADAHHPYAPSELTYLIRSGFDYWALGHVHVRQELSLDPPVVYAGSLLGRTHTDTGARGALLVDVTDREAPEISFRALTPVRWETITVDHLEGADSLDRIEQRIGAVWRSFRDGQAAAREVEWMVRVQLAGPCPLWKELQDDENRDVLAQELAEVLGALDVVVMADRVHPVVEIHEHRVRTDVLGETLRLSESIRRGEARLTVLDELSEGLASDFERLQGLMRDLGERSEERDELMERVDRVDAEAAALADSLGLEAPLEAEALTHVLDRELRRAQRLREGEAAADRELRRLHRERNRLVTEAEKTEAALGEFTKSMTALGGGELERGVNVTTTRLAAHIRADELEDELERAHPDLNELRDRIGASEEAGESWTIVEDDLASPRAAVERLSERIELLATRAKGLDRDVAHLHGEETVDAVDGEIAGLQEEEARLVRERDRRWVLAQLIRDADRRFREEHQPDLIRRAGSYLKHLTGGRYDRILVDEAGAGDVFQVLGPGACPHRYRSRRRCPLARSSRRICRCDSRSWTTSIREVNVFPSSSTKSSSTGTVSDAGGASRFWAASRATGSSSSSPAIRNWPSSLAAAGPLCLS